MRRTLEDTFRRRDVSNPIEYVNDAISRVESIRATIEAEQKQLGGLTTAQIDIADLQHARDILRRLISEPT
jgi:hypothetical protein